MTPTAFIKAFGRAVRQLRESRGLSQLDLAALAGVEQSMLAKIEVGSRHGTPDTLLRLARGLKTPLAEIVRAAEQPGNGRVAAAIEPEERDLLRAYQGLSAEGKRVLQEKARACRALYAKPSR